MNKFPKINFKTQTVPEPNTGCWLWLGYTDRGGYGLCSKYGKQFRAHRIAYMQEIEDPKELFVCHKCDTPACVNPSHLFLGTAMTNNRDKHRKGRFKNQFSGRSHCKNGHPFSPENTRFRKSFPFSRVCIACDNRKRERN